MDQHEAPAAEVARARQRHREREADGHRRVHGVAASPHHVEPDARSRRLLRHDHRVPGDNRERRRVGADHRLGVGESRRRREREDGDEKAETFLHECSHDERRPFRFVFSQTRGEFAKADSERATGPHPTGSFRLPSEPLRRRPLQKLRVHAISSGTGSASLATRCTRRERRAYLLAGPTPAAPAVA